MWFSKPKTKTYTVTSPKCLGYTTDLVMNLPLGFDAPIAQLNQWLRYYDLIDRTCARQLTDQQKVIDKQATEILSLQEAVKRYATEATIIRDEKDAMAKRFEGDMVALGNLYSLSVDHNSALCEELEETEDAYCELYEAYEKLFEASEAKPAKKGAKKNGDKDQKGKPR